LLKRGQVEEVPASDDHTVWGHKGGVPLTLRATDVACRTLAGESAKAPQPTRQSQLSEAPALQPKSSRQDTLLLLLRRK
jgi:hypothetical protein